MLRVSRKNDVILLFQMCRFRRTFAAWNETRCKDTKYFAKLKHNNTKNFTKQRVKKCEQNVEYNITY